jgi:competence protein ComEA
LTRPEVGAVGEEQHDGAGARLLARLDAWRSDRRIAAAVCACLALAAGIAWWRAGATPGSAPPPAPVATEAPTTPVGTTSTTASPTTAIVAVVGAVRAPGVVRVAAGARVFEVIAAAGGATPDADLAVLNLAAPVADGARVAVPRRGQRAPAIDPGAVTGGAETEGGGGGERARTGDGGGAGGPVNLNTASASELEELPGVGPATAQAIINDREQNGPFRTVDDLARVRGIGPAKLEQVRDLVAV